MASNRRGLPEINAGSMADIAFLLLIFFLVTTTMDTPFGINTTLPPYEENETDAEINKRNIYTVKVNTNNDLLVNGKLMIKDDLKNGVKNFVSNYGRNPKLSDSPKKAVVSIQCQRGTSYKAYIEVQDEISKAYTELRNNEAQRLYGKDFSELKVSEKNVIKEKIPKKISEAEPVIKK
tara:strand:+ start:10093 stop:10626 length:534 start_codon:yes stop_codon:yes gene_type:complete